jgi:hypothetical protein
MAQVNWKYDNNKDFVVVVGAESYSEAEYEAEKFLQENAGDDYDIIRNQYMEPVDGQYEFSVKSH